MTALDERHRRAQLAIRADLLTAFGDLWRILVLNDLGRTLRPWLDRVEPVVQASHATSAETARRYYGEARAASIARGLVAERDRFALEGPRKALTFEPPRVGYSSDRTRRSLTVTAVGYTTQEARRGPIDLDNLDQRSQVAASKSAGRLALAGGRETLEEAIRSDPEAVGWARVTDGAPCGFCGALASRGFVYLERGTALFDGNGDPYHDGCGCTCAPRFRTDTSPLPAATQDLQDLWYQTGAYFTGDDALNAFRRAIDARKRGADPIFYAFRGVDRSSLKSDELVAELRRVAIRGGTNGLELDDPRRGLTRGPVA